MKHLLLILALTNLTFSAFANDRSASSTKLKNLTVKNSQLKNHFERDFSLKTDREMPRIQTQTGSSEAFNLKYGGTHPGHTNQESPSPLFAK